MGELEDTWFRERGYAASRRLFCIRRDIDNDSLCSLLLHVLHIRSAGGVLYVLQVVALQCQLRLSMQKQLLSRVRSKKSFALYIHYG